MHLTAQWCVVSVLVHCSSACTIRLRSVGGVGVRVLLPPLRAVGGESVCGRWRTLDVLCELMCGVQRGEVPRAELEGNTTNSIQRQPSFMSYCWSGAIADIEHRTSAGLHRIRSATCPPPLASAPLCFGTEHPSFCPKVAQPSSVGVSTTAAETKESDRSYLSSVVVAQSPSSMSSYLEEQAAAHPEQAAQWQEISQLYKNKSAVQYALLTSALPCLHFAHLCSLCVCGCAGCGTS